MAYKFMLGALPLPIPPSSLSISTPSTNQTVTLINDGEINIPKPAGLREISFEFLLPTFQKYPFEDYRIGNYTAATFINYIRLWKFTKYPIPFIVVRMSPAGKFLYFTSIMCLIEDFTFDEDAEELGFDTKCTITLKEYFFYGTRRIEVKQKDGKKTATIKNTRSTADRVKKTEIKPKEGESLVSAAKREGYDPKEVLKANGIDTSSVDRAKGLLDELENLTPEQLAEELPDGVNANDLIVDYRGEGQSIVDAVKSKKVLENALDKVHNLGWQEPWESYDGWATGRNNSLLNHITGEAIPAPVQDTSRGLLDKISNVFFGSDYTNAEAQRIISQMK